MRSCGPSIPVAVVCPYEIGLRSRPANSSYEVDAAAARWNVAPAQCRTEPGRVICDALGLVADYAAVAADAARLPIPGNGSADQLALKDPADFRIIGKATRALDARAIVTGAARYGIDTALPAEAAAVRQVR